MLNKATVGFSLLLVLVLPTVASASTADTMPTVDELMTFLGYSETAANKLYEGEIISRGLESGTEKELAVTVAMLVRAPVAQLVKSVREGRIFDIHKDMIAFGDLGDAPPDKESFAKLGFGAEDVKEISRLSKVKPGSSLNFSTSEIERLQSVVKRFPAKEVEKDAALREALNAEYRAILMERLKAYRENGLGAVAPYARSGGKQANPGQELTDQADRAALMKQKMPEFHRAILNYPRYSGDDIQNQFLWLNKLAEDRPTFVLAHRMYRYKPKEYVVEVYREFYVGHSYNSLHIVVGALPVKEGTLLFYANRTSTDQVAGFGGGLKRNIGRGMMRDDVVEHFEAIRQSAERRGQ
jgi:hypothetical protein